MLAEELTRQHVRQDEPWLADEREWPTSLQAWARTLAGSASHFGRSHGNTYPAVARPWGMGAFAPQTCDSDAWFYKYTDAKWQGIRCTRQPSPWIGDYGQFVLMPTAGEDVAWRPDGRASAFRHADEVAMPAYYRVRLLRYSATLEATASLRCGHVRVTFDPRADTNRRSLLWDVPDGAFVKDVEPLSPTSVLVRGRSTANCGGVPTDGSFALHFHAVVSWDADSCSLASPSLIHRTGDGAGAGVRLDFDLVAGATAQVNIVTGTSFISPELAGRAVALEMEGQDFETHLRESVDAWDEMLGRIVVHTKDAARKTMFYTCLARSLLFPHLMREFDGKRTMHYSPYDGRVHDGVLAVDNGFWDTYRSVYPLYALVFPDQLALILTGWLAALREGGWFPKWASPGYRNCMVGTHMAVVVADAVAKDILVGAQAHEALEGLLRDADVVPGPDADGRYGRRGLAEYLKLGYVPCDSVDEATARTLDFAYNDWCVARVAAALGRDDVAERMYARAANYASVFDRTTGFFRGVRADGTFETPFSPLRWGNPFVEGSAHQFRFHAPHDLAGLIERSGGRDVVLDRLEDMLTTPPDFNVGSYGFEIHEMTEMAQADFGQYAHSNQPVHQFLFAFAAVGRPDRMHVHVDRVVRELYRPRADAYAGDEDNGEMSAWYVLASIGLLPHLPGHDTYLFGCTRFDAVDLRAPGAQQTRLVPGNEQNAAIDGRTSSATWISFATIRGASTIRLPPVPENACAFVEPTGSDLPYSMSVDRKRRRDE